MQLCVCFFRLCVKVWSSLLCETEDLTAQEVTGDRFLSQHVTLSQLHVWMSALITRIVVDWTYSFIM